MENIIEAPFTDEQVKLLNEFQNMGSIHPFTCMSPEAIPECLRAGKEVDGKYMPGTDEGKLIARNEGWICPCGKYTQDWAHSFMVDNEVLREVERRFNEVMESLKNENPK